jgi:hypothetical protein
MVSTEPPRYTRLQLSSVIGASRDHGPFNAQANTTAETFTNIIPECTLYKHII